MTIRCSSCESRDILRFTKEDLVIEFMDSRVTADELSGYRCLNCKTTILDSESLLKYKEAEFACLSHV